MPQHVPTKCFLRSVRLTRRWTVSKRPRLWRAMVYAYLACAPFAPAQTDQNSRLDQQFQSAVAQFHARQLPQAAAQLEQLLRQAPKSFEVRELLGLVYAAQSQDAKAVEQLQAAVHLKPESAAAHTNLAAALVHAGSSVPPCVPSALCRPQSNAGTSAAM